MFSQMPVSTHARRHELHADQHLNTHSLSFWIVFGLDHFNEGDVSKFRGVHIEFAGVFAHTHLSTPTTQ